MFGKDKHLANNHLLWWILHRHWACTRFIVFSLVYTGTAVYICCKLFYMPSSGVKWGLNDHVKIWTPDKTSGSIQIFVVQCKKIYLDRSRYLFPQCKKNIWIDPDNLSTGYCRNIWIYWLYSNFFVFGSWWVKLT